MRSECALVALLGVALGHAARGQDCPSRPSWPTLEWPSRAVTVAAEHYAEVRALDAFVSTQVGADQDASRIRTDVVMVIQAGEIIFARYDRNYENAKTHIGWEVAGSVTNALTGLAVQQGALRLDDSICRHLEGVASDRCAITVQMLLEQSSGIDWTRASSGEPAQADSELAMLYGEGHLDMARFVVEQPLRDAPGSTFNESTGDATLLAAVVDAAMRKNGDRAWPWAALFNPIGMGYVTFERDLAGRLLGGTHFWANGWDYSRLGYLFLNDGCWDGTRYLPAGWVAASTTMATSFRNHRRAATPNLVPGRLWWINRALPEQGLAKPWPQLPDDTFAAIGRRGQCVFVIPSADLVVVRNAEDGAAATFDFQQLVLLAMAAAAA